jgi:GNAT superfamily N-acetyltransferase
MAPTSDSEWRDLVRAGMPPCWGLMAEGSGGSVWRDGDVCASIVPQAPERSVFNSVFYEDPQRLLASLDAIQAAYDEAGVRAWTVWVPEGDREAADGLEAAGHAFDAEPRYMAMPLTDLVEPEPRGGFEIVEREDYDELARLNEIAYGYPPGDYAAVAQAPMPGIRIYFAELDGEPVSTLGVWPHLSDAVVIWVATLPEARNRGIATRLMAHGLRNAREDGYETTTLQATKLGRPVYERLGYRDYGAGHMWEKRAA